MKIEGLSKSEQLLYSTVLLVTNDGKSAGTGFLFCFRVGQKEYNAIITNKHVVKNDPNQIMKCNFHLQDSAGNMSVSDVVHIKGPWIFHSTEDLCFRVIDDVFVNLYEQTGKRPFIATSNISMIATDKQKAEFDALERVTMVGYPIGIWDEKNNFLIFRRGYTASHPAYDFDGDNVGLIDIAAFPGSSGSPVYIFDNGWHKTRDGGMNINGRLILLGILKAVATYNVVGEVKFVPVADMFKLGVGTKIMVNLGYYIKAEALKEFQTYLETH